MSHAGLVLTVFQNHLLFAISHFLQGKDNDSRARGDNGLFITLFPNVLYNCFLIRWLNIGNLMNFDWLI